MAKFQPKHAIADLDQVGLLETTSETGVLRDFKRDKSSIELADEAPPGREIQEIFAILT